MKVYRRLVLDIATGRTVEEDAFEYVGTVASAGGGKMKSKTTVVVPPPTPEEEQDKALGRGINLLGLGEQGYDAVYDPNTKQYTFTKRPLTPEQQEEETQLKKLREMSFNRMMGIADPETQRRVGEVFQSQRASGNEELTRYMNEQAGARGLNLSDTPLLRDLGLQKSRLETGLRGAEAASLLDVGQANQIFGQSMAEFQNALRQQAFLNKQSVGEQALQSGLGLGRMRMGQATTTQTQSGGGGLGASLLGGGLGMLGQLGAAAITRMPFSSRDFKDHIDALSPEEYAKVLADVEATPVYRWNYKPELAGSDRRRHIGPVVEESPEEIFEGKMLVPIDYMGFMFAAIKALTEKVKRLEDERLPV